MLPPIPNNIDYDESDDIQSYVASRECETPRRGSASDFPTNYPYVKPNTGMYRNGYGTSGRLGPSDLRNLASETPVIALASGLASGATELAYQINPEGSIATNGVVGWVIPFMLALLLKVIAAIFRTHGKSLFETIGTNIWIFVNDRKKKQNFVDVEQQSTMMATLRLVPTYTFILLILGTAFWVLLDSTTSVDMPWLVLIVAAIGGITADIIKSRI